MDREEYEWIELFVLFLMFSEKLGDVHFVPRMDDIKWEYKSLIDGSFPPSDALTETSGLSLARLLQSAQAQNSSNHIDV